MVGENTPSRRVFLVFNTIILIILSFVFLSPMLHVLFASFSDPLALARYSGIVLWPRGPLTVDGYRRVFQNPNILTGYMNTIFYVGVGTTLSVIFTALAGYALSRKRLVMRNRLMLLITFTMLFNGGLIPTYMVVKELHLLDSRAAVILTMMISAYNLIIMRTFFGSISDSLEESARIDGARDTQIFFRIYLPLAKAGIAVMALYYGVAYWNTWFGASIYLQTRDKFPLQLVLRNILLATQASGDMMGGIDTDEMAQMAELIKYALIVVATFPILCVYPFLQKYFVKGVMVGAIKG